MLCSDDIDAFQLTVVREINPPPPYRKGTRTRLTARTFIRICQDIEAGRSVTQSCKAEGLTYRRFRQLCQQKPSYQRRYEKAEETRAQVRRDAMEQLVLHAALKNWVAAAWWLERVHPSSYSLRSVARSEGSADAPVGNAVPLEVLMEDARLAAEIAAQRPAGLTIQAEESQQRIG
jgi:hypothetical protein